MIIQNLTGEQNAMYIEEYEAAKKEFINCLVMGWIGLRVP